MREVIEAFDRLNAALRKASLQAREFKRVWRMTYGR